MRFRHPFTATILALVLAAVAAAQPTDVTIQNHVYRPAKLEPTDARLSDLKLPPGFQITRFSDGLGKPRMMAAASDGSVYVTRREPGDC